MEKEGLYRRFQQPSHTFVAVTLMKKVGLYRFNQLFNAYHQHLKDKKSLTLHGVQSFICDILWDLEVREKGQSLKLIP